jgi:hypothetical protein
VKDPCIPNQFFNQILPTQPLSVLKVVGAVIRFSIGFEARRGFRRQQASLSYSSIQCYTRIISRQDMATALKHALASNFIERVAAGRFDREAGRARAFRGFTGYAGLTIAALVATRGRYVIRGVVGPDEFHDAYPDAPAPDWTTTPIRT